MHVHLAVAFAPAQRVAQGDRPGERPRLPGVGNEVWGLSW